MYRVDLYIDGQRGDLFQEESIEINLSVQNIKDISKVFGDFTNSFTIPASPTNNAIFKHYYNVDIYGGFNANVRVDSFIEVNNNLFRTGVLELESVQIKDSQPYAYQVGFYSNVTSLKDTFGEDKLNDLDLSAQDHQYNDTNIVTGFNSYVSGTDSSIIYPLISPVANWYYNSVGNDHTPSNIYYQNGHPEHGTFYYDYKPAIKLQKIIDAIEAKYGIEFQSDFFDSADFGKLFMWCHRRAGYMFKDQPNGSTNEVVNFTSSTGSGFNTTTDKFTFSQSSMVDMDYIDVAVTSTDDYAISLYVNGELYAKKEDTGNATVRFITNPNDGDVFQIKFSPISAWDASVINLTAVTASFVIVPITTPVNIATASTSATQTYTADVIVADQMPEQKISDFIGSLVRAFNLVIVPVANNKYDIEPLDDWYAEGTTRDVTEYIDTEEITIRKPSLYRRINFKYNETEAILGEQYRLQNDIGYGDLRADFTFDGEEFSVEVGFDHMLFERLSDQNPSGAGLTTIGVGKSITREIEPYIGSPVIFYVAGAIRGNESFSYVNMATPAQHFPFTDIWQVGNVNNTTAESVTKTLNFGTEVDPYLLQGFSQGLYNTYWKDYITDLYDTSRRTFQYSGQLPLGLMLALKINDKLTIGERNYIINQMKLNLSTGETQMELLNDV
ncbi:MAG: hypothetical protein GY845_11360 [Planctomycetes bacterium]|nr:hypothetical protein [Planctomycetota bacterium]